MPRPHLKRSVAWLFFDVCDGGTKTKCKICGAVLQFKDSSTTGMIRHLARRHDGEEGVGSVDDLLFKNQMMKLRKAVSHS